MNRRTTIIGLILILCVGVLVIGCMRPAAKVTEAIVDGQKVDVVDQNEDGMPDLGADGKPIVLPGSGAIIKVTEAADAVAPNILETAGTWLGVPLLIGVAAAWRRVKFGRIFRDTVSTFQSARLRIKVAGHNEALAIIDETLGEQTTETTKMITKAKVAMKLPSVSKLPTKTS